jgi:hypothetical protein
MGMMLYFFVAWKNAGQFWAELWSVSARIFNPQRLAIPTMLLGVLSSSPQGESVEWI